MASGGSLPTCGKISRDLLTADHSHRGLRRQALRALIFGGTRAYNSPRFRPHRTGGDLTSPLSPFELELARLVVAAVNLDVPAEAIDPDASLFREGLGLDSIDLLEIALVISQEYGCTLRSDDPDNDRIFSSLRNLAAHVATHREK